MVAMRFLRSRHVPTPCYTLRRGFPVRTHAPHADGWARHEKRDDDFQAQLRSLSNRVWGILVAVLATLLTVVMSAFKPG